MKTIEELEAQLTVISEQIKELKNKPKFEVNRWYHSDNDSLLYITKFSENKMFEGYGFYFNNWESKQWWAYDHFIRPATLEEVYAALVKEAEKRGFKEGVRVVTCLGNSGKLDCSKPFYNINDNKLRWADSEDAMNNIVFDNGQWATIIKDDVIKVGSYEVKKKGSQYEIGCKQVSWNLIDTIRIEMKRNNFKKVSFDGIETDLETIEKILNL